MFKVNSQRSRSQRDVTWPKIGQIMNNSAGYCSISIKLTTDYDHMTPDLPQTFKVKWAKFKVIACHDVLALKNRYMNGYWHIHKIYSQGQGQGLTSLHLDFI